MPKLMQAHLSDLSLFSLQRFFSTLFVGCFKSKATLLMANRKPKLTSFSSLGDLGTNVVGLVPKVGRNDESAHCSTDP